MTLCRSWPLYGVLALALVVRAGWADDAPAKAKKSPCCEDQKKVQTCDEKCCVEEVIQRLVQLGQMCNPSCDDDADCPKCPIATKKTKSLNIELAIRPIGAISGVPLPIPHIGLSCIAQPAKTAACKPCPEGCPPCGDFCTPCAKPTAVARQYCVETRWVTNCNNQHKTLMAPKITVLEGQTAKVAIGQDAACKITPGTYYGARNCGEGQTPPLVFEVQVLSEGPNRARLKLHTPECSFMRKNSDSDYVIYRKIAAIEAPIETGKSYKLPLSADVGAENATEWFEVKVNAIAPEGNETAECMPPRAAMTTYAVPCAPICSPAVAAAANRAPACPPQACAPAYPPQAWQASPAPCPMACVAATPVGAYHYSAAPQMFYVRAFRNHAGDVVVEPPLPAPMMPRLAARSVERYAAMPMPVGMPMPCPVACSPATVAKECATSAIAACAVACPDENCKDDTKISVVTEDGESRLQVDCGNDRHMSFSDMRLKTSDGSALAFAVENDRVRISTTKVTASADHVRVSLAENRVVLEGNVKLAYRGKGMEGSVEVETACINLKGGKVCVNVELSNESEE